MSTVTHLMSSKLNDFSSPPSDSRCDLRRLLSAKPSCFLLLPFAPSPRLLITAAMGQPLHSQPIRLSFFKELNIFRRWLVELGHTKTCQSLQGCQSVRRASSARHALLMADRLARFVLIELYASPEPHPKGTGYRCIHKIISYHTRWSFAKACGEASANFCQSKVLIIAWYRLNPCYFSE